MSKQVNFRLCGTHKDFKLPLNSVIDAKKVHEDLHDSLLLGFSAEHDAGLHFHFEEDECDIRRPLKDLGNQDVDDLAMSTIMVHLTRRCSTPMGNIAENRCLVNVRFQPAEELCDNVKAHLSDGFWEEKHGLLPRMHATTLESFEKGIKDALVEKLQQHEVLQHMADPEHLHFFADEVDKYQGSQSRMVVRFHKAVVYSPRIPGRMIDLGSDHPYIRRLQFLEDFLIKPHEHRGRTVDVDVKVSIEHIQADPVKDLKNLVEPHVSPTRAPTYVRLGEVYTPDTGGESAVTVRYVLAAQLDEERRIQKLLNMNGWGVEGDLINDPEWAEPISFYRNYQWDEQFQGCKSRSALERKLQAGPLPTGRVPFMPPMSFKRFNPFNDRTWGFGFDWCTMAVRLVSHIDNLTLDKDFNIQVAIDSKDHVRDVVAELHRRLEKEQRGKSAISSTPLAELLREAEDERSWRGDLWIRPDGVKALHKATGYMIGYICHGTPNAKDEVLKQLYAEYHFWPGEDQPLEGL